MRYYDTRCKCAFNSFFYSFLDLPLLKFSFTILIYFENILCSIQFYNVTCEFEQWKYFYCAGSFIIWFLNYNDQTIPWLLLKHLNFFLSKLNDLNSVLILLVRCCKHLTEICFLKQIPKFTRTNCRVKFGIFVGLSLKQSSG